MFAVYAIHGSEISLIHLSTLCSIYPTPHSTRMISIVCMTEYPRQLRGFHNHNLAGEKTEDYFD
jgi:hypothetical protein